MQRDKPERNPNHIGGFVSDVHATILGSVYGLRAFEYTSDGRLTGITYPQEWVPGVNTAQCFNPTRNPEFEAERERTRRVMLNRYGGWPMSYFQLTHPSKPFEPGPSDRAHNMKDCSCGFWLYHNPVSARRYVSNQRPAGIVRATGRVVPGELGYRAVNAEIVALARPWGSGMDTPSWNELVSRFGAVSFQTVPDMLDEFELTVPDPWMLPGGGIDG